jgi:glycosyltransferase involved in cell wall biosynthesis
VAILDERKNQSLILKAFAQSFGGNPDYELVIAGDGKLLNRLRAEAEALNIGSQVEIPGYQTREEVKGLLDRSHVFVLASHSETFGVVVIEAMARGIPAISSNIDGTREIISPENGLLFEPNNLEALSRCMEEIAETYSDYSPALVIESVKKRFGPDAVKNALFPND